MEKTVNSFYKYINVQVFQQTYFFELCQTNIFPWHIGWFECILLNGDKCYNVAQLLFCF